jgi:3-isopropylmalate dehydrogenase
MTNRKTLHIAVLPGDGIGHEIMPGCLDLLSDVTAAANTFRLDYENLEAGAALYQRTGEAFPEATFQAAAQADAILLGAMGLPGIRYADGREIAPQLDLRERLALYAGLRPVRRMPGLPPVLADARGTDLDFVIIRESTEGLFASRSDGVVEDDRVARDTMVISRPVCERLFDFTFRLAAKRKRRGKPGRVTCVDKANVLGSQAFFRQIFDERARQFADVAAEHCYVDAMALNMVKHPWDFDVLVMENMFGDILSDLSAALVGGMGMAPSADIGDRQAVFQPCHGSAPDIVGQGKANPTAMILSGALMLEWLAETHDLAEAQRAADRLTAAVEAAFAPGRLVPCEMGGTSGTQAIFEAVRAQL